MLWLQAVEYVKSGMVLGLGTGSTAAFAVAKIGELLKVCVHVLVVAPSLRQSGTKVLQGWCNSE